MTTETRTRTRTRVPTTQYDWVSLIEPPSDPAYYVTQSTHTKEYDHDAMTDVKVADFYKRIAQGEIINNPCSYSRSFQTISGSSTVYFQREPGYPTWNNYYELGAVTLGYAFQSDFFAWGLTEQPSVQSDDDLEARAKLVAYANIDTTPYAFGEDTLEIRETIKFLKNPLEGILNVTRSFERKRGDTVTRWKKYLDRAEALKDLYLEYRFASSPLYRSLCDALDAYVGGQRVYPTRLTSRGFAIDEDTVEGTHVHVRTGKTDEFDYSHSLKSDYHASILYEISNPIRDWKFHLGFRMKDLPTTFWQVVPLSFMVDRLYDVSSFSKGILNMADPKVKILAASVRAKHTDERQLQYVNATRVGRTMTGKGDVVNDYTFTYNRTPWLPTFRDVIPKPQWSGLTDSATKMLDLAAISSNYIQKWLQP